MKAGLHGLETPLQHFDFQIPSAHRCYNGSNDKKKIATAINEVMLSTLSMNALNE